MTGHFNEKFEEEKVKKDGSIPQSSSPPLDHSEEMATMLLYYISQPKVFKKLKPKEKLSAFLAIEAVALHSMLADTKKEERICEWSKTFPFGLFLSSMDLLAEVNRLHWSILDTHHPLKNCKLEYSLEKNWKFLENVDQQKWERKILLGQIVGIWDIEVIWENDSIDVKYYSGLKEDGFYGVKIVDKKKTADEENLYSPSDAIDPKTKKKQPYLKESLQSLLGIKLRNYELVGGENP